MLPRFEKQQAWSQLCDIYIYMQAKVCPLIQVLLAIFIYTYISIRLVGKEV